MAPNKITPEEDAERLQTAIELGLPEGWRAKKYPKSKPGSGPNYRFWDPSGELIKSVVGLASVLGTLPAQLQSRKQERDLVANVEMNVASSGQGEAPVNAVENSVDHALASGETSAASGRAAASGKKAAASSDKEKSAASVGRATASGKMAAASSHKDAAPGDAGDKSAASVDQAAAAGNTPAASSDKDAASGGKAAGSGERAAASSDEEAASGDNGAAAGLRLAAVDRSAGVGNTPAVSVGKAAALGEQALASGEDAATAPPKGARSAGQVRCAEELGLPPGWGAWLGARRAGGSRNVKFWDPTGTLLTSSAQLLRALGYLPEELSSDRGAAKVRCAEEFGLPPGWGAKVTENSNGSGCSYKFWDPSGELIGGIGELAKVIGTLPEKLQRRGAVPSVAAADIDSGAEKRRCAEEFGLPPDWGAEVLQSGGARTFKFWDPSGNLLTSTSELVKVLGHLPEKLPQPRRALPSVAAADTDSGAEKRRFAEELGLPPEWAAEIVDAVPGEDRTVKFWDPSGNILTGTSELLDVLGYLPAQLQPRKAPPRPAASNSDRGSAKLRCAEELGLPPGWGAKVTEDSRRHSRTYKFWDPSGKLIGGLGELAKVIGTLPEKLQSRRGVPSVAAADTGSGAEKRKCAEELGLPPEWAAEIVDTVPGEGRTVKFWDPNGNLLTSTSDLLEVLGYLPEKLQPREAPPGPAAASFDRGAAKLRCAEELGLPPGWGARIREDSRRHSCTYKFWDPSGMLIGGIGELAKVIGTLPEKLQSRRGVPSVAAADTDSGAERRRCAEELGLPPEWAAEIVDAVPGEDRIVKFWDPNGNLLTSTSELLEVLGYLPKKLQPREDPPGPAVANSDKGSAKVRCAEEFGLPPGWGAKVTENSNGFGCSYKFWDPSGKLIGGLGELTQVIGTLPEKLQSRGKLRGKRRGRDDPERRRCAEELGLPPEWGAAVYEKLDGEGRVYRFWDPSGGAVKGVAALVKALGILPAGLKHVKVAGGALEHAAIEEDGTPTKDGAKKQKVSAPEATAEAPASEDTAASGSKRKASEDAPVTCAKGRKTDPAPAPSAVEAEPAPAAPSESDSPSSSSQSSDSESGSDDTIEPEKDGPESAPQPSASSGSSQSPTKLGQNPPAKSPSPPPARVAEPKDTWEKGWSDEFQLPFWWNPHTDESVWEPPPGVS